jgi:enoyl-CoA hydratase/carnithine racemase
MNADVLTTRVADRIVVITLGSARRMYFDGEMGDALTEALDGFAGDRNVRVVIVTGWRTGCFNRHFNIPALIRSAFGGPTLAGRTSVWKGGALPTEIDSRIERVA